MTAAELKRAKELCEAAGPGPWLCSKGQRTGYVYVETAVLAADGSTYGSVCWMPDDEDDRLTALALRQADFIAASRTLLPAAIEEIERLRGLVVEACEIGDFLDDGDNRRLHCEKRARLAAIRAAIEGIR